MNSWKAKNRTKTTPRMKINKNIFYLGSSIKIKIQNIGNTYLITQNYQVTGIMNNIQTTETQKKIRIKLYSALAFPGLLCVIKNWTTKKKNNSSRGEMYEKNSRIYLDIL
jgi:uncharacterized membrane protein